jgi:teichuronic acid biosynthesis glycosyltransferase TuaG
MITILMPIYNGIEFIEESISSIINQTYTEWELIIGINGHPENSEVYKIAFEYTKKAPEKIKVIDFYNVKGKAETLNEMVKYSKYDYIALLDVDDIWHPKKLEKQIPFLSKYDVIGTKCVYFGDTNLIGIVPNLPEGDFSDFDFFQFNPIINSSAIIRKTYCHWNPKWFGIEDYDLWLSIKIRKCRFYNCSEIAVKHRIHQQSAFNAKGNSRGLSELLEFWRNLL